VRGPRRWLGLLASAGASLVGALPLVEISLRLLGLHSPVSIHVLPANLERRDTQTHWDLTYATNSLGLRGPDRPFARPAEAPDLLRIVAIGDSMTFGQGVEFEETFPSQLERLLRADDRRAEVINVSRIGSGPESHFMMLREIGLRYDPDVVILNVFGNDASDDSQVSDLQMAVRDLSHHLRVFVAARALSLERGQRRNAEAMRDGESRWSNVVGRCAQSRPRADCERYVRGFRGRWGSAVNSLAISILTDPQEVRRWVYTDPEGPGWLRFRRYVGEMAGECARAGCRFLLGIVPDGVQIDPEQLAYRRSLGLDYPDAVLTETGPFQDRVIALAGELQVGCFDATPIFRAAPTGLYYPADLHMTAAGQRLYAESLLAWLEAGGHLAGRSR
jgi:lysophospholipase L1-like esterase